MKNFVSILILLTAVLAAYSQSAQKVVVWSGDKTCGFKSKAVTADDLVKCGSIATTRGPVSTIRLNGIALAAAFLEDDDYNIVGVHITNDKSEPVLFDSDLWGAAHFKTREDYFARKKPIAAETSFPSRDIVRGMSSDAKLGNSLDTFIAEGQRTVETKEVRRADGTRYKVDVIVPDKNAQLAADRRNINRTDTLLREQRRIRSTALTAKSVPPYESLKGLVYFRRKEDANFTVFSLAIHDVIFIFQVPKIKN